MTDDEIQRRVGPADGPDYENLHATVVDAIKHVASAQSLENGAHEALQRLSDLGLPIPVRPPDDPFADRP
ncbi:hypothetical protein [Pseudonocardia sp. GCM10023141]|uniref:hypothetical protein n=1 Tax=Pseudonocardia sp. GCM10023141 TaxID=3252653 RepID=UPI00361B382D